MGGVGSNRMAKVDSGSLPFNIATISHSSQCEYTWQRGPINACQERLKQHGCQSIAIVTPGTRASPRIFAHLTAKKPPWTVFRLHLININNFYRRILVHEWFFPRKNTKSCGLADGDM